MITHVKLKLHNTQFTGDIDPDQYSFGDQVIEFTQNNGNHISIPLVALEHILREAKMKGL
jgi:hypothetical protein